MGDDSGCGHKMVKCYFIILNSILMVFGVAALIVGIVAIQGFTMDEWPQELKDALENEFITSFSLYVIITGGVCFIFGLFGIASATCAKNVVTLYIYIFLLFLLGVIQVALGVYCITAEDALSDLPLVGADLKTAVDDAIQDSMCTGTFTERQDAQTTFNDAFGCQTVAGAFGVTDASVVVNQDWYDNLPVIADGTRPVYTAACTSVATSCQDDVAVWLGKKAELVGFVSLGMGLALLIGCVFGGMIAKSNKRKKGEVPL